MADDHRPAFSVHSPRPDLLTLASPQSPIFRLTRGAALVAVTAAFAIHSARAQYASDFESLAISPTAAVPYAPDVWDPTVPPGTAGQGGFYNLAGSNSVPFRVQAYTGGVVIPGRNDHGIPDNPSGGGQFLVGLGPAGGLFARAHRDLHYTASAWGADTWVWAVDICVHFAGTLPASTGIGAFQGLRSPTNVLFTVKPSWTDSNSATSWDCRHRWRNASGGAVIFANPDPAFYNLLPDRWYRVETVGDLATNRIVEVRITDLLSGVMASVQPAPGTAYMLGGATTTAGQPMGFRCLAGSGLPGNVLAWDNPSVLQRGVILDLPGCGSYSAALDAAVSGFATMGAVVALAIDAPASGPTPGMALGVLGISLVPDANLPCGTTIPGPVSGNAIIGAPVLGSLFSPNPWTGPNNPVQFVLPLPSSPTLSGLCLFLQGGLLDTAQNRMYLTNGKRVDIGG